MSDEGKVHPDFLKFESKVNQVAKMIDDLIASQTSEGERATIAHIEPDRVDLHDFIATTDRARKVKVKAKRLICNDDEKLTDSDDSEESELDEFGTKPVDTEVHRDSRSSRQSKGSSRDSHQSIRPIKDIATQQTMDQFTFMKQIEDDADKRAKQRRQREELAQQFREMGNKSFHNSNFEHAVLMYTRAIEHVKDSPILYNNRAFAYIKLKNYKRALIDCDFVLNKLDERNLRSWMYRAAASKRNVDDQNYESSIRMAKEKNSKQHDLINDFVYKIEAGDF